MFRNKPEGTVEDVPIEACLPHLWEDIVSSEGTRSCGEEADAHSTRFIGRAEERAQ